MPNQPARKDDPLRGKKTGKWTKYGGSISGLLKAHIEDHWYCQVCGDEVPEELKPFLFEIEPGEFIRICPSCTHEICTMTYKTSITQIIRTIRVY